MEQPLVIRIEEAAKLLGIGRDLAYRLARAGEIPSVRLGRRLVVPRKALELWLEEQDVSATSNRAGGEAA